MPFFLGGKSRVRFWAARVFLAGNGMKIAFITILKDRMVFKETILFPKTEENISIMSLNDSGVDITFLRQGFN